MPQYDGSIRINTNIEIRNAEKQIADLENSIQEMSKGASDARKNLDEMNKVGVSKNAAEYKDQSAKILEMSKALGELTQKREELLHVMEREWDISNGDIVDNAKYQEAFSLWEEAKQRTESFRSGIGQYFESISESASNSAQQQTQSVQKTAEDYNILKTDVEEYANALKELEAQGKYFGDEDYDRVYVAWKQATNAVNEYKAALNQKANGSQAEEIEKHAENTKIKISDIVDKFSKVKSAAQNTFSAIVKGFSNVGQAGSKIFSSIKNIAKKAFSSIGNVAKKAFSSVTSGSKTSGGALSGFATRVKGIAKTVLVFNLIRQAFNAMVSTAKEGFTNFSNYSSDFSNSVQNIKNSVSQIGNQIAAAFAPVVQTVIPWLQMLADAISTAISYVAQFIALLTGKSTFIRAKKVQDGYNKSLGGTASAAKKAYGALAKFDDLDVLQKKEEESGSGAGAIDPDSLFEEVPIDSRLKDFFDWLKDMWNNADFYGLGKKIGEALKKALESIPWDEIKEVAGKIGKSLASLINGIIEVDKLGYMIGYTLAQAFNTGFEFLNAFVHELHWESIGRFIADTLNGLLETIDWPLIYDTLTTGMRGIADAINSFTDYFHWENVSNTISKSVNTVVDTIYEFFDGVDFSKLGEKIGEQLTDTFLKIDFGKLGETLAAGLNSSVDFVRNIGEKTDWSAVGKSIADGVNSAFRSFNFASLAHTLNTWAKGLLDAVISAVSKADWKAMGKKIGDFLSGIDLAGIAKKFVKLLYSSIQAALKAWSGSFDVAPVGTALISAFGMLKLGNVIADLSSLTRAFELSAGVMKGNAASIMLLAQSYPSLAQGLSNVSGIFGAFSNTLALTNDFMAASSAGFSTLQSSMSIVTKGIVGAAAAFAEFSVIKTGIEDIVLGTDQLTAEIGKMAAAIGAAGAAFSLILGFPGGIIATAVVGLVAAIAGIGSAFEQIEAESAMNAVGNALKNPGGTPIENITGAYVSMIEQIGNGFSAISEKSAELQNAKNHAEEASGSIDLIRQAIKKGVYSAEEQIPQLNSLFGTLLSETQSVFEQEYDTIMVGLSGAFGDALEDVGVSIPQIVDLMNQLKDDHQKALDEIHESNRKLDEDYANGLITAQEYYNAQMENYDKLNALTGQTDEYAGAVDTVSQAVKGLDFSTLLDDNLQLNTAALSDQFDALGNSANEAKSQISGSSEALTTSLQDYLDAARNAGNDDGINVLSKALEAESKSVADANKAVDDEITKYGDTIQSALLERIPAVIDNAVADYGEQGWFYKLFHTEADHVQGALDEYQSSVIDVVANELSSKYEQLGVEGEVWAGDAAKTIIDGLFETTTEYSSEGAASTSVTLRENYREVFTSAFDGLSSEITPEIEEVGKNITDGLERGITENSSAAGTAVEDMAKKAIDTARETLGVHSPSTVFCEIGHNLIEGLLIGIQEKWDTISEYFTEVLEGLKEFFSETWTSISETAAEAWNLISQFFSDTWTNISETINTVWESIKQFLSETWTTIQTNATTIYTAIKTFLQTTWENIKATATTVWNAIKTFLQTTWTTIQTIAITLWTAIKNFLHTTWTNMQNLAVSIWTAIKNWFFETWQAIKEKALEIWENVRAVFEEKFNAIKEKTQEIISKFNEFRSNVSEVFHNIRDTISETIGSAIGKLSDFISKIREAIEAIKDFLASGFEKVSGFVGGLFGGGGSGRSAAPAARAMAYTMPEIPALASGAVIRGGDPFLAFLGDQPRGQTNIEAPLATIERAVENAMSRNGYGNERVPVNINLQYDGETFARLSLDDILSEANRRGFDVSILGVT